MAILISFVVVVAMFLAGSKLMSSHSLRPSNPYAPVLGAADKAKTGADAASRAAQQQNLLSGSPDVSIPSSQVAGVAP